jgi:hypothetical protein
LRVAPVDGLRASGHWLDGETGQPVRLPPLLSSLLSRTTRLMNKRISRFLADHAPETPCLVVDLEAIAEAYEALCWQLPLARVFYAVKANPAPEIITVLERKGASFDVASRGEIELCRDLGVGPERLSFGNTIKKEKDITFAYEAGLRLFAFERPAIAGWSLTASRSMSARSRPTPVSGTTRSALPPTCSRCWPPKISLCAWSTSAAASRPITAVPCRRPRIMPAP